MQKTVGQLLDAKGSEVWTIGPEATVYEALQRLADKDIGALVVVDGGKVCGIISERDYARKIRLLERESRDTKVSEIMTGDPATIGSDGNLAEALEIMSRGGFHHLPVTHDGKAIGLLSNDDIPDEYRMLLERFKEMRGG